jgi:hypothetical protein
MSEVIIIKTKMERLHSEEHFQFHKETADLIGKTDAETLHAEDLTPKHAAKIVTLDTALQKIVKSPRTEQIHAADRERDETYRGLVGLNKVMALHHDSATRAAAGRVQIVIDTYGSVLGLNYEEETGTIYNLVQDLKSERYAADVALVGLTPWVLKLEQRNNAFQALLNARDEENAAGCHIAVKDARQKVDKIYARIRNRVNSYVDDETANPALEAFITQLNIIAKRFNTLAARHRKKGGKKGGGETGGNTE